MDTNYYSTIPAAPGSYNSGNVVARMLHGAGFRYYWATEDITQEALAYQPSADGRNTLETIRHICDLTEGIVHVAKGKIIEPPFDLSDLNYEQLRSKTLENIATSAECFSLMGNDLEDTEMLLKSGNEIRRFPLWNVINGPISDAIYHIGQVVSFRRSAGNPVNPNINPFLGIVK